MEKAEISDYIDGECNADLSFQEFLDLNPSDGDKTLSGKGQLIHLGKYGIRYQGANPNNYVYFNCSDYSNQSEESCETWRIIGIVDGKVKLIRNESIGQYTWDDNVSGKFDNNWSDASLNSNLNGTNEGNYYASLSESTKTLISPSTWYLRSGDDEVSKYEIYDLERTSGTILHETPQIDNTNIGLMYPSDFGFAALETGSCLPDTMLFTYSSCYSTNWLSGLREWFITPNPELTVYVFGSFPDGNVYNNWTNAQEVFRIVDVRPTIYLSSNIEFTGNGSEENKYKISVK